MAPANIIRSMDDLDREFDDTFAGVLTNEGAEAAAGALIPKIDPSVFRRDDILGWVARKVASVDSRIRYALFTALAAAILSNPRVPGMAKTLIGRPMLEVAPAIERLLQQNALTPAEIAQIEAEINAKVTAKKAEIEAQGKSAAPADECYCDSDVRSQIHRTAVHAPPEGDRARHLVRGTYEHVVTHAGDINQFCRICFPWVPALKPAVAAAVATTTVAATPSLSKLSDNGQKAYALFFAILQLRLRDVINAPPGPHRLEVLLSHIDKAPSALKALESVDVSDYDNVMNSLGWLASWWERGGFSLFEAPPEGIMDRMERWLREHGVLDSDPNWAAAQASRESLRAEYEAHREFVHEALTRYAIFRSMLEAQASAHLTDWQNAWLPARDAIDEASTAESRARTKRQIAGAGRSVMNFFTHPCTMIIVALTLTFVFIGIPVLAGLSTIGAVLFTGVVGLVALYGMWVQSPVLVCGALIVAVLIRFVIVLVDVLLTIIRKVGDFLDPTDGTGIIGGSIGAVVAQLRNWGVLAPLTPAEEARKEAQLNRVTGAAKEMTGYFRDRAMTVLIAWSIITAAWMVLWTTGTINPVTMGSMLITGMLALVAAEIYNRGWRKVDPTVDNDRLINIEERRQKLKQMLAVATAAAFASAALTGLAIIVTMIIHAFGGDNTDRMVELARGGTTRTLDRVAVVAQVATTPTIEVCLADREHGVSEIERARDMKPGSICADPKYSNAWPCNCEARPWTAAQECISKLEIATLSGVTMTAWECPDYQVTKSGSKDPRQFACDMARDEVSYLEDDKGIDRGTICADATAGAQWPCDCSAEPIWEKSQRLIDAL